jgi:hypothetical protein
MPELSQRTLGYVRDVLDEMEPEELDTPLELRKFWKRKLFDAGFPQQFIDIVATYQFDWAEIIPDLYSGKFGPRNQSANAYADPSGIGKEFLNKAGAIRSLSECQNLHCSTANPIART